MLTLSNFFRAPKFISQLVEPKPPTAEQLAEMRRKAFAEKRQLQEMSGDFSQLSVLRKKREAADEHWKRLQKELDAAKKARAFAYGAERALEFRWQRQIDLANETLLKTASPLIDRAISAIEKEMQKWRAGWEYNKRHDELPALTKQLDRGREALKSLEALKLVEMDEAALDREIGTIFSGLEIGT